MPRLSFAFVSKFQRTLLLTLAFNARWLRMVMGLLSFSDFWLSANPSPPSDSLAPTVAITNPADAAVFAAGVTATITATASASTGRSITKVEFFAGPLKLGEDTVVPAILLIRNIPAGHYIITAKATDNQGSSATSAPINITVGNPPDVLSLFTFSDDMQWRYNRDGKDLGTAWKNGDYDDSKCPAGLQPIGDNSDGSEIMPIRTPISRNNDAGQHVTTLYVRGHFNFPLKSTSGVLLTLRNVIDDGAVFYLNGVEVSRFSMGTGAVTFATFAMGHEASLFGGPEIISSASLVPGDNVFAVEVHQADASSSDIVFGAELVASIAEPPLLSRPVLPIPIWQDGKLVLNWPGPGTLQSAEAITGPWIDVSDAQNPFAIPLSPGAEFYRLKR